MSNPRTMRLVTDDEVRELAERATETSDEPLFMLCNEVMQVRQRARGPDVLNVTTMVGTKKQAPVVVLNLRNVEVQMSPETAREHATVMLNAASAAETDAFLVGYLTKQLGATDGAAMEALRHFREYREAREREAAQ